MSSRPVNGAVTFALGAGLAVMQLALPAGCRAADPAAPATAVGSAAPSSPTHLKLPVSIKMPGSGFLSLALYDGNGVLVRTLANAEPVTAGDRAYVWDGTTDMGLPARPGKYEARGIFFKEKPSLEFVLKVGKSGNPPYRTADGKGDWGANLGHPSSIVSNGQSVMLGYGCVEDNQITGIQQMDGDGNISQRYYSFYPWDVRHAAAMDGTNYYLGIGNLSQKTLEIAEYKLGSPRGKILVRLPAREQFDETETRWRGRWDASLDGLALSPDTIYASIRRDDALFLIDRASGKIRQQVSLPSPCGLAFHNGKLLAVSGGRVVRLNADGQVEGVMVAQGTMRAPNALAVDNAGNMYVGDGGAIGGPELFQEGSKQVYVFSPQGRLLRKLGKPGGAPPEGRYEAGGFGYITSLCVGPEGKLWVNDIATGFPRTTRWSPDGKLEREWFARKLSLWADNINPARPNEVLYSTSAFGDEPGMSAWTVDFKTRTWKPGWHYRSSWAEIYRHLDTYNSHNHGGNPLKGKRWPVWDYGADTYVTHQGRNYFMNRSGNGEGAIFQYGPDHKPKPVALVGYHRVQKKEDQIEGFYDQGPNNWFTWADKNGDGKMTLNESAYTEAPAKLASTRRVAEAILDDKMNIRMKLLNMEEGREVYVDAVLPLKQLLPNGVPVYDWADLQNGPALELPDLHGGDGTKKVTGVSVPIPLETEDSYYALVTPNTSAKLKLPGIDGEGWWASRNWRKRLVRWDKKSGKALYAVGRRAPGRALPGQMYHPVHLSGAAGDALFIADTLGLAWVWDKSGLFVGQLYNGPQVTEPAANGLYGEIQSMVVWTEGGKIYIGASDTGNSVHEVHLPVRTPLQGGTITLDAATAARAVAWDPDGVSPAEKPMLQATYVNTPPKIDGEISGREWMTPFAGGQRQESLVLLDGEFLGGLRVQWDAENLYLAYRIRDKVGPLNAGSELPFAPFVSGAYVDFSVAPRWTGPREEVAEGDVRVLLARVAEGGGFRDFQQGFWQKLAGGKSPQTIRSPAAQVHMDHIGEVPGLRMAYSPVNAGKDGCTYSVEVAVPLAALGLTNPAGKTVGFDASIATSNTAGNGRERAGHWAGLSESAVVDRPGSTRLLPGTWGTLTFVGGPGG